MIRMELRGRRRKRMKAVKFR